MQTFDQDGIETIEQYDSLGRLTKISRKDPGMEAYYDPEGGEVVVQQTFYDGDNNVVMTISGSGTDVTTDKYMYDAANRQMEMKEGFGSSVEADTFYFYDKVGNLETVTDPRTVHVYENVHI